MLALALGACAAPGPGVAAPGTTTFSLESIDGRSVHLSDHLGRDVVLLTFWATWCAPCLAEMPVLEVLYQRYRARGFTVLSISMDGPETVSGVDAIARRLELSYPVLLDAETRAATLYNPAREAPFAVLIGRDGRIAQTFVGYSPGDEQRLEERIAALLAPR